MLLPFGDFKGLGINKDKHEYSKQIYELSKAMNVRISNDKISRSPFYRTEELFFEDDDITPNNISFFTSYMLIGSDGATRKGIIVFCENKSVYVKNQTATTKIGESVGVVGANSQAFYFAGLIYVNPVEFAPFTINPADGSIVEMDFGETGIEKGNFLTVFRNHLILVVPTITGVERDNRLLWSSQVSSDSGPPNWDFVDETTNAGYLDFDDISGNLVAAYRCGDFLLVYSNETVHRMYYTGDFYIFGSMLVFESQGALNPKGICESDNANYYISANDIFVTDGNTRRSIVDQRIKDYLSLNIADRSDVQIFDLPNYDEVYIMISDNALTNIQDDNIVLPKDTKYNQSVIYNKATDSFYFNSFIEAEIVSDAISLYTEYPWDDTSTSGGELPSIPAADGVKSWKNEGWTWNDLLDQKTSWGDYDREHYSNTIYVASENKLKELSKLPDGVDEYEQAGFEKVDIDLHQMFKGQETKPIKYIDEIRPIVTGEGSLIFQVGVRNHLGEEINWTDEMIYTIGTTHKLNFRKSGRYFSYRVFMNDPGFFELSALDINVREVGLR